MASRASGGLLRRLKDFWNAETGPKTSHFWGPVANWGFVLAGLADTSKPPENVRSPLLAAAECIASFGDVFGLQLIVNHRMHMTQCGVLSQSLCVMPHARNVRSVHSLERACGVLQASA